MSTIFPPEFVNRMGAQLGDELDAFLDALAAPPEGLRVNSLRLSAARFEEIAPFAVERLAFPEEGFTVEEAERPGKHPYHSAGLYYLQDPGAMYVGAIAAPAPGERVLDLAAAPGGKATHLASRMRNEGLLVANDVSRPRARELASNLERFGVRNALVLSESADRLAERFGGWFDRVLLDAPCSGESMFHKSEAARADWSPTAVAGCARRQSELIDRAADLTAPGGLLVYSTCTFSGEENEEVVEQLLRERPDFEPADVTPLPGATKVTDGIYRLWPHQVPGAGHFVAVLRRRSGEMPDIPELGRAEVSREALEQLARFREQALPALNVDPERLRVHGRELYELPPGTPRLEGLSVLRSGLWLGTLEKNRFEPSHALALVAGVEQPEGAVRLRSTDDQVVRYLSGHPIESEGPPGWVPVLVDGFALGWGKRVGSTVKNHYPKGLRWRG